MNAKKSTFARVEPTVDFPAQEEAILALWKEIDAFRTSIELRPEDRQYSFYDGPPFATGSPHYGNLLAGIIKDIVPRYWTMRGYRVERRFGWDTHGLPVEMEVEKQLGISGPRQIQEYGVDRYNEACRAAVQTSTEQWEEITARIGRWVDFDNDYKTLDTDFMETVWWVFRQLWDKGLIYKDFKVLPYSWGATTPLSNFEANMDYRDVDDPAITMRLQVTEGRGAVTPGDWLTTWTTTPWTLPSNLAIAVGEEIDYVAVLHDGERHWVAANRLVDVFGEDSEIVANASGSDLLGVSYEPPFDYFGEERDRGAFRVIGSDDVTMEEGTGLVHMAPAYGEADFVALQGAGLDVLVDPVDAEARFTEPVHDVAGMYVKDADKVLTTMMKERGLILKHEQIRHSYPFCWRTGTPLIYKAIPTWFVNVESFRDRMIEHNKTIHWVPTYVGEKRFGNWLENARDWAISRNRYWGSCIPVWECDTGDHAVCIGSIDELEQRSGVRLDDLHKHHVDPVTFACPECPGTMTRVPEVLDCWFESGSMPYAQKHYPFENAATFDRGFPANFIAEGLDQTRGWFYTLVVLATALFDKPPFDNCVVNGLLLAEDGMKMSKSLKNYPDPRHILDTYGADPLRAYLINSPALRAEPLRFSEAGVHEVARTVLIPLWNAFSFFTTYAEADGITMEDLANAPQVSDRPELDRWILSVQQSLLADINREMEGYYLYNVVGAMLSFIDDLTNWYIRRSRRRFWRSRSGDDADKLAAFATLYEVLITFVKALAPVLPFVTEHIYQTLVIAAAVPGAPASVHHCDFPESESEKIDPALETAMGVVRSVVSLGHNLRKQEGIKVRQPLGTVTVMSSDRATRAAVESHVGIIANELNTRSVAVDVDDHGMVQVSVKPDFRALGPRLGGAMPAVAAGLASLSEAEVAALSQGDHLSIEGHSIGRDDVEFVRAARPGMVVATTGSVSVALDTAVTEDLLREGQAREVISEIQRLRRGQGLAVSDRIIVRWNGNQEVAAAIAEHEALISDEVLADSIERSESLPPVAVDALAGGFVIEPAG